MELSPRDTHDVFRLPPGAGRADEANQPFRPLLRQFLSIGILVLSQLKKVQQEDLQRHKATGKMFFPAAKPRRSISGAIHHNLVKARI